MNYEEMSKTELIAHINKLKQEWKEKAGKAAELEEKSRVLSAIFRYSDSGMFLANDEGYYTEANRAAEKMLGYSRKELLKMTIFDLTGLPNNEESRKAWTGFIEEGNASGEFYMNCKDGSKIYTHHVSVANIVPGVHLAIINDITARKEAEDALQRSEERHRLISRMTSDYHYSLHLTRDGTLKLDSMTEAFAKVTGYDITKGFDEDFLKQIMHPDDKYMVDEFKEKVIRGDVSVRELRIVTKDGETRWLRNFFKQTGRSEDGSIHIIGAATDITEKKRAELVLNETLEELKMQKKDLEEKNRRLTELSDKLTRSELELLELNESKDRFFSLIAHDLRSPFHSLLAFSKLLNEQYDVTPNDKKKHYLKRIDQLANHLNELVQNLLVWARLQSGRYEYQPQELDLSKLTADVLPLLAENAERKNIGIEQHREDGCKVEGDKKMLRSVLMNLLSNAIKFTDKGGKVKIKTGMSDRYGFLSVEDNGRGLTPEEMDKIFRIDEHFSEAGTSGEAGNGLGLMIVNDILRVHKGKLDIKSEKGSGSKFTIKLPRH